MNRLAVLAVLLFTVRSAATQEVDPYTVLRTPDGVAVVWNESAAHFTLELKGKTVAASDVGGVALYLDNRHVQVITQHIADFAAKGENSDAILRTHIEYERKHWSEQVGKSLPAAIHAAVSALPKNSILWEISFPDGLPGMSGDMMTVKNLFFSSLVGDRIVVVGIPVRKAEDPEATAKYLQEVASTLSISKSLIDPKAIQESIKKARK